MNHSFDMQIAIDYDVNTAIFLNNLAFWINKNIANRKHYYEGTYWTYNSYNAFTEIFPYWTYKQIRTIIDNAVDSGLLIKGNFNKKAYDQTNWYSLTDKALKYFPIIAGQILNTPAQTGTPPAQTGRPIPDSKPDSVDTSARRAVAVSSSQGITPVELTSVFAEELPESPQPLIHASKGHLGKDEKKAIHLLKEHFEAKNGTPLTIMLFRKYLQYLKKNCRGFVYNEYPNKGTGLLQRNGFLQIVNWENYDKTFNGTLK